LFDRIRQFWLNSSLTRQFALAAAAVLLPGTLAMGWWLPNEFNKTVIDNAASGTILYMDGLLAPLIPEIRSSNQLSMTSRARLGQLVEQSRKDGRIVSIKVWKLDGTIIYSTFEEMVGQNFTPSEDFIKASNGELAADFNDTEHEEDKHERATGVPLLEVYAPLRDSATREIIAVSEFYADATNVASDLRSITRLTWLAVGGAAAALLWLLSMIVSRGSNTIAQQRLDLLEKVDELKQLLHQNEELRLNLRKSNESVAEINEHVLQRVGAELHDGPAQMLAYSVMRTSQVRKLLVGARLDQTDLDEIRNILQDTMREVRHLSAGLVLPELRTVDLVGAVNLAVTAHADYTGTKVETHYDMKERHFNEALKTCVYRFVQEGLNNAYKHADAQGQRVVMSDRNGIEVKVSDDGPGMNHPAGKNRGMGLTAMRSRIMALGGTLEIELRPTGGTTLTAAFPSSIAWD
jgi:signal transduction histidine kinase